MFTPIIGLLALSILGSVQGPAKPLPEQSTVQPATYSCSIKDGGYCSSSGSLQMSYTILCANGEGTFRNYSGRSQKTHGQNPCYQQDPKWYNVAYSTRRGVVYSEDGRRSFVIQNRPKPDLSERPSQDPRRGPYPPNRPFSPKHSLRRRPVPPGRPFPPDQPGQKQGGFLGEEGYRIGNVNGNQSQNRDRNTNSADTNTNAGKDENSSRSLIPKDTTQEYRDRDGRDEDDNGKIYAKVENRQKNDVDAIDDMEMNDEDIRDGKRNEEGTAKKGTRFETKTCGIIVAIAMVMALV